MKKFLKKSDRVKGPSEKQVEEALRVLRSDYYSEVKNAAYDLMERVQSGEIKDVEGFDQALHELVDGDRRVFVTFEAQKGLLASSRDDAYFDEGLGELTCTDSVPYEQLMFWAYRADIMEEIESRVRLDGWPDPTDEETYE